MDDLDFSDLFRAQPMRGLGDFHLRSALTFVDIKSLKNQKGRWRERRAFGIIQREFGKLAIKPGVPIILLEEIFLLKQTSSPKPGLVNDLIFLLDTEFKMLEALRFQGDLFERALSKITNPNMRSEYSKIKEILIRILVCCMAMTSKRAVPDFIGIQKKTNDYLIYDFGIMKWHLFGELFCRINRERGICFVYSIDHLRLIVDKVTERDNVLIATQIGNLLMPSVYPTREIVEEVFSIFDKHLQSQGNNGYALLKTYEALVTTVILENDSGIYWDKNAFRRGTLDGLSPADKEVAILFLNYLKSLNLTIHHLTQLMGLFRLWGHPVIDAKAGMRKVREIGTAPKVIDEYHAKVAGWKFKEIFFLNFFKRESRYPNFSVTINSEVSYLINQLLGREKINLKHPEYTLMDWDHVNCDKTFDIPSSFNLSMIVADTAISPTRTEIRRATEKNQPAMDPLERRGVLKWMKDGMIECKPLLESVDNNPTGVDKDHLLIGLYPKEREQNVKARMFALMPLLTRSVIVVTEHMLADHILPYVPGITMTYSMLELQKQMIHLTTKQARAEGTSLSFCINMDFEKWNLNMRRQSTFFVFKELGRLFGLETLYNKTYDIFENSIIYLADGSYIVQIDEDLNLTEPDPDLAYEGHIGGFEGLRQKGWTIFTVCLISYVCDELGVEWKLMGQGDNQVLLVTIHSNSAKTLGIGSLIAQEEVKRKLHTLVSSLEKTFSQVSLPLKLLETWVSENFFSYGKIPIYKGVPSSSSLKRISRIFFFSNEDLMTLDNALGAISSNAQAAAMTDPHPIVPYIMAKYQHLQCIDLFLIYNPLIGGPMITEDLPEFYLVNPDTRKKTKFSAEWEVPLDQLRRMIAIVPKTLGGYNILTFFEMISRGFSDPPNRDYQYLVGLTETCEDRQLKPLLENWCDIVLNDHINYTYLVRDPTGINLLVPTNSTTAIREMIQRTIGGLNFESEFSHWFQELLKVGDPKSVAELCYVLTQGERLNVRFLHDILGATIFGYSDAIASKIDKTVTLSRIALGQEKVVDKLVFNEIRFGNYFAWRCTVSGTQYTGGCPSKYIREIRKLGWRKDVEGVDVPHPFHFMTRDVSKTDRPDSYVEVLISDFALETEGYTLTNVGHSLPYLGSITKEKVLTSPVKAAYGTEPLISRPLRLLRAIGWFVQEGSNFGKLLKDLIRAVCDLDPDALVYVPDDVKGSMIHRYSDFATKHGSMWLPLYGPATFLNLSTNHFLEFSKGSKNVTLHFQALLCYVQMIAVSGVLSSDLNKVLRIYRGCTECITSIIEDLPDLPEEIPEELIPCRPDNPYLYLKEENISLVTRERIQDTRGIRKVPIDSLSGDDRYRVLTYWMAMRLYGEINSVTSSQGDSIFDIASVDRTHYLKVNPKDYIEAFFSIMWISVASEPKHSEGKYPVWASVKSDIVRILERVPSSGYSTFAGYYLWEESMEELRKIGAEFPMSYPASPSAVAIASKSTVLKLIKRTKRETLSKPPFVIVSRYEADIGPQIKWACISKGANLKTCSYCVISGLQLRSVSKMKISDILSVRCEKGHNLLAFSSLLEFRYLVNAPIDAVADGVKPRILPEVSRKKESYRIPGPKTRTREVVMNQSDVLDHAAHFNLKIPGSFHRSSQTRSLGLSVTLPTDSLYSAYEGMGDLYVPPGCGILVLGDGYGYSSSMVSWIYNKSQVYSWSLIDISSGISHAASMSRPPTHYALNPPVDCSPTFELHSDISNFHWKEDFQGLVIRKGITHVLSEVEFWYTGEDYTETIIEECYKAMVQNVVVAYHLQSKLHFMEVLTKIDQRYEEWSIEIGLINNCSSGTVWFVARLPRKTMSTKVLGVATLCEAVNRIQSIIFGHGLDVEWSWRGIMKNLEKRLLENELLVQFLENQIDSWFEEVGIGGWCSRDLTPLMNRIRTGRRPRGTTDLTGSDLYYLHEIQEKRILMRLLALGLSMITSSTDFSTSIQNPWKLSWYKGASGRWLIKINIEVNGMTFDNRETQSILRFSDNIRGIRKLRLGDDYIEFTNIGTEIKFSYLSRKQHPKQVIFPVSKISSYY